MKFIVPSRGDSPRSHLPIAIIIDKSESTKDIRDLLNKCIVNAVNEMKKEALFKNTVDLLVIHYSSEHEVVIDFEKKKKIEWKSRGEKYYQPLVFLLTDGYPDAGVGAPKKVAEFVEDAYISAASDIKKRECDNKIVFIAAGIEQKNGVGADMKRLSELSNYPERVLKINEASSINGIENFFDLIYESTNATFTNTPVDDVINHIFFDNE